MEAIDFEKMGGLIPAIVQESDTGEVLMLGFMNQDALAKTLETNMVTFWSRTRKKLWMKGEISGNVLQVETVFLDCDADTLLIRARMGGNGVCCHTGARSCFHTKFTTTQ